MKLKKRRKQKKKIYLVYILFISIICAIFLIYFLNKRATPVLMSYAETEIKKVTTLIINKSITTETSDDMDPEDLFEVIKNKDDEIQLISYNSYNVSKLLSTITNTVQVNLKSFESGNTDLLELPEEYNKDLLKKGIIYKIPIGVIYKNSFLSNLGPKIPIRLSIIGDVVSNVETKVTEYGINNAMLEMYIKIDVNTLVNLPFTTKEILISTNVPIATKVIQGKIPDYYPSGITSSSNLFKSNN